MRREEILEYIRNQKPNFNIFKSKFSNKYFNSAGCSIPFDECCEIANNFRWHIQRDGLFSQKMYPFVNEILNECRISVANLLKTESCNIALTMNATEGIQGITNGIDWKKGDNIITSDREHPSLKMALKNLNRFGVNIITVRLEEPPQTQENLPSGIRFAAMSLISYISGIKIHPLWIEWFRNNKVLWLADATQAIGHIPISVKNLGCDFLVASGHKWLHAPLGTGFLYVSSKGFDEVPFYPRAWRSVDYVNCKVKDKKDAIRFEQATQDVSVFAGLALASNWCCNTKEWEKITRLRTRYAKEITDKLKNGGKYNVINSTFGIVGIEGLKSKSYDAREVAQKCFDKAKWDIKYFDCAEIRNPTLRISLSINNDRSESSKMAEFIYMLLKKW